MSGHDIAPRRVAGAPLRALATANVVSENAARSPSRVVRLGTGRVSKTTVTPVGGAWGDLPVTVLARDLRTLERELDAQPPRLIRPRVEAESVRVVEVATVQDIGYSPGDQRLTATFSDGAGVTGWVSATYAPYRPGALDHLAEALAGERGEPLYISGPVRRARGALVVDPIAVMTTDGVVVPDLAPGDGGGALDAYGGEQSDPLTEALAAALEICADAAHRGLRHLPNGTRTRVGRVAEELSKTGLATAARLLRAFGSALDGDDPYRMTRTWTDAQLHLITASDMR